MKKFLIAIVILLIGMLQACGAATDTTTATLAIKDVVSGLDNPYNIALFLTDDPYTKMAINFEMPSNSSAYVEYREVGENFLNKLKANKKIRTFNNKEVYLYEAVMEGLSSGTTYEYRVVNEDSSEKSEFHNFTMPSRTLNQYSFLFLADPQENAETGYMAYANAVLSVLDYSKSNFNFVMFPGDTVNDRDIRSQWNMFFQYSSFFSYNKPMAVALGNHEMPSISDEAVRLMEFDGYFNLPNNGPIYGDFDTLTGDYRDNNFDNGKTYSFNYGNCHYLVIDTEIYCDGTTACTSYDVDNAKILDNWVERDLQNNTKPWTIVMLHRGPYSLSYDTESVRDNLIPIFDKYNVDLVLSGHDHQYSRSVYHDFEIVKFNQADTYDYGTLNLDTSLSETRNFNNYSSSLGVTYLVSNTVSTKFYGGDKSSGLSVNYAFIEEYPVIPIITVSDSYIQITSYAVMKDSALSIVPSGVFILEQFRITK